MTPFRWPRLTYWVTLSMWCVLLCGCGSAKKRISDAAMQVQRQSVVIGASTAGIASDVKDARVNLAASPPDTVSANTRLDSIDAHRQKIDAANTAIAKAATAVQDALPRVEDKGGFISTLGRWLTYVAIVIGVILLIRVIDVLGLKPIINKILSYFPALIDWFASSLKREAEADVKVLDDDDDMELREAIAAKRAANPAYDAAFERAKQQQILRKAARKQQQ